MRIRFGPFTLNVETRQLRHETREIEVSAKAFDLLTLLVLNRPNVVSKADLQKGVWPDTFVAEANLSNLVAELRHALGDSRHQPAFIRTVHGFGYAFCGDASIDADRPACWLECGRRRFPLTDGPHVIGRDPQVDITLDDNTVSRRHARIVVSGAATLLEDFGSKNGTFRGEERVTDAIALADGDEIRIGSVLVVFHVGAQDATETIVIPH